MLLISGMRGNGCRDQITRVLESVAGVKSVDVNLYRARVTILHDQLCEVAELIRSVAEAGYDASLTGEGSGPRAGGTSGCHDHR